MNMRQADQQRVLKVNRFAAFSAFFALIAALATPLSAQAADRTVSCTTGSFTVAQEGDEVITKDASSCSGSIVIPSDVTYIGIAFQNNRNINSIEIGSAVTRIGNYAFANSSNLRTVTFAANSHLTEIGEYAFDGADVRSLSIPSSVTMIREAAFTHNSNLTSLTFEAGSQVQQINRSAFFGADIRSILIPNTVTYIGNEAFRYNYHLGSITFAANSQLTSIGEYAFEGAPESFVALPANLQSVNRLTFGANIHLVVPSNHQFFSVEDGVLFNADKTELVSYPGWKLGASYTIPSTVTTLAPFAFENTQLTSVNIPASVSIVGNYAFYRSRNLATATIAAGSNICVFGYGVFNGTLVTSLNWPTTLSRSGYRFLGWSNTDGGALINNPAESALADAPVYAVWQSLTHSVNYDSNFGSAVPAGSFVDGGSVTAPVAPTRDGYTFAGWSVTLGGSAITFPYTPAEAADITLFALWTEGVVPAQVSVSVGATPTSRVASIPAGNTAASIPATTELPRVSLNFAASNSSATVTVTPIANPAASSATPFAMTSLTKIVDIQVNGITGPVTVCLDGAASNQVFHFTVGAWSALSQLTFVNGQVCGVTESFSPFAAADMAQQSAYAGPKITGRLNKIAPTAGGSDFTITGDLLSHVTSVNLEGKPLTIVSKSDSQIVVRTPAHGAGLVDLELKSASVSLIFKDALVYQAPVQIRLPLVSPKAFRVSSPVTGKLSEQQRRELVTLVSSAQPGSVLTCGAEYSSEVGAKAAKAAAASACAIAKQSNKLISTRVSVPVLVKSKSALKVLLSLNN